MPVSRMGNVRHVIEATKDQLLACLAVERWAEEVAGSYPSKDELIEAARTAAEHLTTAEIDEAIAHHPRIGETPTGDDASAAFSRREQASLPLEGDDGLGAAIAAGNSAYEERFGRVFIIRAAGRTRADILAELERRMGLDDETELRNVGEQLVEIAMLRLESIA
jgi:2-oxo-4-hydroxy-4-carboxy-5-ureidoimidazoline decarboxylase